LVIMFKYWFLNLCTMFPDYENNTYGMSRYTKEYWDALRASDPKGFEHAMAIRIYHNIFKSTEVI